MKITTEQLQRMEAVAGDVVRAARWPTPGVLMNRESVESYLAQHGHVWAPRDADDVFRQARHIIEKIAATPTERATALARLDVMMGDEKPLDGTDVRTRDTEPPTEDRVDPSLLGRRIAEVAADVQALAARASTPRGASTALRLIASDLRAIGEHLLVLAVEVTR